MKLINIFKWVSIIICLYISMWISIYGYIKYIDTNNGCMLNYIQDYKEGELGCSYYDISYKTYHIDRCRVGENNLNLVKQGNIYGCLVEKKGGKIDILNTTYCGIAYLGETIFSK